MKEKIKEFYEKNEYEIVGAAIMVVIGFAGYFVGNTHGRISMLNQMLEKNDIKAKI